MKFKDINEDYTFEYIKECDGCGKRYKVISLQKKEHLQPMAGFLIKCDSCEEYVDFEVAAD